MSTYDPQLPNVPDILRGLSERVSSLERKQTNPSSQSVNWVSAPSESEVATDDVTVVPIPIWKPETLVELVLIIDTGIGADVKFKALRNGVELDETEMVVSAGSAMSPILQLSILFAGMGIEYLDFKCTDDGGGGYGGFNIIGRLVS